MVLDVTEKRRQIVSGSYGVGSHRRIQGWGWDLFKTCAPRGGFWATESLGPRSQETVWLPIVWAREAGVVRLLTDLWIVSGVGPRILDRWIRAHRFQGRCTDGPCKLRVRWCMQNACVCALSLRNAQIVILSPPAHSESPYLRDICYVEESKSHEHLLSFIYFLYCA